MIATAANLRAAATGTRVRTGAASIQPSSAGHGGTRRDRLRAHGKPHVRGSPARVTAKLAHSLRRPAIAVSRIIRIGRCLAARSAARCRQPTQGKGPRMADLIAVAYPDESTAKDVLATLARLQTE